MNALCAYSSLENLSFKKDASQSPIIPDSQYKYLASNAVDGNKDTCMRTNDIGTTALHKSTLWKVDLGGVYSIYDISVLFKNYEGFGKYINDCKPVSLDSSTSDARY